MNRSSSNSGEDEEFLSFHEGMEEEEAEERKRLEELQRRSSFVRRLQQQQQQQQEGKQHRLGHLMQRHRTGFEVADEDVPMLDIASTTGSMDMPRKRRSRDEEGASRGEDFFSRSAPPEVVMPTRAWDSDSLAEISFTSSSDVYAEARPEHHHHHHAQGPNEFLPGSTAPTRQGLSQRSTSFSLNEEYDDRRLDDETAQVHIGDLIVGVVANANEVTDPSDHSSSAIFESFFDLTHARLLHIFKMFDDISVAKETGVLDYENFRNSLKDAGLEIKDKESFERLVKKVDLDMDGGITFNEFETVVQSLKLAHMFRSTPKEVQGSLKCVNYNTKRAQSEIVGQQQLKHFMYAPRPSWASHRWIDLTSPCIFNLKCLAIKYRLHPLALEDCLKDSAKTRAKLDRYDAHMFLAFPILFLVYEEEDRGEEDRRPSIYSFSPRTGPLRRIRSRSRSHSAAGRYGSMASRSAATEPLIQRKSKSTRKVSSGDGFLPRDHAIPISPENQNRRRRRSRGFVSVPQVEKHNVYIFLSRPDLKTTISVVDEDCQDIFQRVRRELDVAYSRLRTHDGMYLVYTMLDTIVDSYTPLMNELEDIIEVLSDQVRDGESNVVSGEGEQRFSESYHDMIRKLNNLKRWILPAQRMITNLILEEFMDPDIKIYLRDVHDHLEQLTDEINSMLSRLTTLKGEHNHVIEVRMSGTMNALTVIATFTLPGQFLASVFGMNFEELPGLKWRFGYLAFWVVTFVSWVCLYVLFRRKGVL